MFTPRWHTPSTRAYAFLLRFFRVEWRREWWRKTSRAGILLGEGKKIEVSIEGWDMSRARLSISDLDYFSPRFYRTERSSSCRTRVTDKTHETSSSLARTSIERGTGICDKWRNFFVPTDRFLLINGLIGVCECYASDYKVHFVDIFFPNWKYHDSVLCASPSFFFSCSDKGILKEFVKITGYFLISLLAILKLLIVCLKASMLAQFCACFWQFVFSDRTSSFTRWKIAGCKFSCNTCSKYTVFRWNFGSLVPSKSGTHMHACQRARFSQLRIYWRIRMCYGLCTMFGLKTKYIMHRRKCMHAIINGETHEYNYEKNVIF